MSMALTLTLVLDIPAGELLRTLKVLFNDV